MYGSWTDNVILWRNLQKVFVNNIIEINNWLRLLIFDDDG